MKRAIRKTTKTVILHSVIAFSLLLAAPTYVSAQGLSSLLQGVTSNLGNQANSRDNSNQVVSIGGGIAKQRQRENKQLSLGNVAGNIAGNITNVNRPPATQVAPTAEYRGYNGRTVEQAFLGCKYDSYRAAAPGLKRLGLFEKIRIRSYVIDSCMNKEGFFRKRGTLRLPSLNHLTAADFGF